MQFLDLTPIDGASAAATQEGSKATAGSLRRASVVFVVAGATTPEGTGKLQGSNDPPTGGTFDSRFTPTNWADVPDSSVNINANGSFATRSVEVCHRFIRPVFTYVGGSGGTVTAYLHAEGA